MGVQAEVYVGGEATGFEGQGWPSVGRLGMALPDPACPDVRMSGCPAWTHHGNAARQQATWKYPGGMTVTEGWDPDAPGVLRLPSGRLVRGRALRRPLPPGPVPTYALHLLGRQPPEVPWPAGWLRWPDFRLPADPARARELFGEAWARAADPAERVEFACGGGRGRTGTALACVAVLDGVLEPGGGGLRAAVLRPPGRGDPVAAAVRTRFRGHAIGERGCCLGPWNSRAEERP